MIRKTLLICGVLSSLFYVGINIFVPPLFEGYGSVSQTVSELSAINAPTRTLWILLAVIYILLFGAFGFGVRMSALGNRRLRITGLLIIIYVIINVYWPPMHLRGNEPTLTDTLHIVWAMMTLILMMTIMGYGAAALGKPFRIYTILTFLIFIAFGVLIGVDAPNIPKNLPTPQIGIWERINIGAFMLWVIVFAVALLQKNTSLLSRKYEHSREVSHQTDGSA
jgi:amino acid transporter